MSNYKYESGAIHNDNHKETTINISGPMSTDTLKDIARAFLGEAEDAQIVEEVAGPNDQDVSNQDEPGDTSTSPAACEQEGNDAILKRVLTGNDPIEKLPAAPATQIKKAAKLIVSTNGADLAVFFLVCKEETAIKATTKAIDFVRLLVALGCADYTTEDDMKKKVDSMRHTVSELNGTLSARWEGKKKDLATKIRLEMRS